MRRGFQNYSNSFSQYRTDGETSFETSVGKGSVIILGRFSATFKYNIVLIDSNLESVAYCGILF